MQNKKEIENERISRPPPDYACPAARRTAVSPHDLIFFPSRLPRSPSRRSSLALSAAIYLSSPLRSLLHSTAPNRLPSLLALSCRRSSTCEATTIMAVGRWHLPATAPQGSAVRDVARLRFFLPSPFLLPPLVLILSLTPSSSFFVAYRRPMPNCKQPPPGGSPTPEPTSSSPTSPTSILVGSGAAGPPCASAALPSPSAGAASVRCLFSPLPRPRLYACARAARPSSDS